MLLRLNDRGDAVKELQAKLGLKADGHFGPVTQAAVIVFQKNHGLVADGIVGPSTMAKLGMSQTNNPAIIRVLTRTDFINAGAELQCNGKAVLDLVVVSLDPGQLRLQICVLQIRCQPALILIQIHIAHLTFNSYFAQG